MGAWTHFPLMFKVPFFFFFLHVVSLKSAMQILFSSVTYNVQGVPKVLGTFEVPISPFLEGLQSFDVYSFVFIPFYFQAGVNTICLHTAAILFFYNSTKYLKNVTYNKHFKASTVLLYTGVNFISVINFIFFAFNFIFLHQDHIPQKCIFLHISVTKFCLQLDK